MDKHKTITTGTPFGHDWKTALYRADISGSFIDYSQPRQVIAGSPIVYRDQALRFMVDLLAHVDKKFRDLDLLPVAFVPAGLNRFCPR